jgi:hypothetical protein
MSVKLANQEMQHLEQADQPVSKGDARYITDGYIDAPREYTTETKTTFETSWPVHALDSFYYYYYYAIYNNLRLYV